MMMILMRQMHLAIVEVCSVYFISDAGEVGRL
jgi:hypothetical protein